MVRIIAVLIIFLPGVIGALGIKLMRDAFFSEVYPFLINEVVQFIVGLDYVRWRLNFHWWIYLPS